MDTWQEIIEKRSDISIDMLRKDNTTNIRWMYRELKNGFTSFEFNADSPKMARLILCERILIERGTTL
jgi:hypothetical protein